MIIYELTNKENLFEGDKAFSKFYGTKDEATKLRQAHTKIFKHDLISLGREEIAMILSMGHVNMHYENGWQEVHDISSLVKSTKEVS
jgi:hypothetical protein|tara:strand:+ start:1958 stop:2218 length:261 start_codon:yes stop_codon:yes gene_type:complete